MDLNEITRLIEDQNDVIKNRLDAMDGTIHDLERKAGRPVIGAGAGGSEVKAFLGYMRTGADERRALTSGSDPQGGYLIPTEIDTTLTKYLRARSPMRQLARVVNVGAAEFKEPHNTLGAGYTWVGETTARPETTAPEFKLATIPTREVYAAPQITQNLLDDNAFDLGSWLVDELGDAFGDAEGDAFVNGNGVSRPRGLFTYDVVSTADATREHGKFQYVPTGGAGAFAASNPSDALIALVHAVKPQYRTNASWLMSGEVLEACKRVGVNRHSVWLRVHGRERASGNFGWPLVL